MVYNSAMNKTTAKKYLTAIEGSKKKYITCENLSRVMGIYPEVIAEQLSFFEPILAMDPSFDLKELVPAISKYIQEEEAKKVKKEVVKVSKKDIVSYKSVSDFIYKKMTFNGLVDHCSQSFGACIRHGAACCFDDVGQHKDCGFLGHIHQQ